jgi:DNA polymerase bacteriophage-type
MSLVLWIDLETRSTQSIKKGIHKYAEGSEIILIQYAIDDSVVQVHDCLSSWYTPDDLADALEDTNTIVRSHGSFDRVILNYHGYNIPLERWECTMSLARSCSLPGSLDKLCKIFNISSDLAKLDTGKDLIKLFCIPNKKGEFGQPGDYPVEWESFKKYGVNDISAMREVYKRLPKNNFNLDRTAWAIYERMNDNGFKVDLELANSAIDAVKYELDLSKDDTARISQSDTLLSVTQTSVLLAYISERCGRFIPNLTSATVSALIKDADLPDDVLELLELRQNISKSSTAKYKKVVECACEDGFLRGTMVFNGALRTRRNSGAIFQPLNLPRPTISGDDLRLGVDLLKCGMGYLGRDTIMPLCSSALRGVIVAEKGKKLIVSDWSNIEGRLSAWFSHETWKVDAFRAFDEGQGHDLYKVSYAKTMSVSPADVTKDQRQIGKVQELALGYGGGVPAFLVFAGKLDIPDLCRKLEISNHLAWEKSVKSYEYGLKNNRLMGLDEYTYKRLAYIVQAWRLAHPNVVKRWYEVGDKVSNAVSFGFEEYLDLYGRRLPIWVEDRFLHIELPSRQRLMYLDPKIDERGGISFTDGRYGEVRTYGSKIFENIIQSMNRDILCGVLPICVAQGYNPLLTIYDEIVAQSSDMPEYSEHGLSQIMVSEGWWYKGLPLAAEGYEDYVYRKAG